MSNKVTVTINDDAFTTQRGIDLIELCDNEITDLNFMCRKASCATCLIEVIEGAENINPVTGQEKIVLSMVSDNANARLACQVRLNGNIKVETLKN